MRLRVREKIRRTLMRKPTLGGVLKVLVTTFKAQRLRAFYHGMACYELMALASCAICTTWTQ